MLSQVFPATALSAPLSPLMRSCVRHACVSHESRPTLALSHIWSRVGKARGPS
jgi:hypothetical protein